MGVLEPELQISNMVSVVARLAGGIYAYDFDGTLDTRGSLPVADDTGGVAARAEAALGLKLYFSSAFSLTVFGGIDYWSETPIPNFPEVVGTVAFVDRTDMLKVKAGVMATIAFGGE